MGQVPDTREQITAAGYACIARFGPTRTSVEDVAQAAGVSRATMYRYFPGGRAEHDDDSLQRTAIRETKEELGLCLDSCAEPLGRLSELRARSKMRPLPMSVLPIICQLTQPAEFSLNHEVIEALWIPLDFFLSPGNRGQLEHPNEPDRFLPCYRLGERVIWGLSLAMIDELLAIQAPSPPDAP